MSEPAKLAVIDLGSNSFRLVVFTYAEPDEAGRAWWRRTDEIHEPVRIAAGQQEDGTLAALKGQHGIEPERPPYQVSEGGSRICFVRDPDGYRIEIIESGG